MKKSADSNNTTSPPPPPHQEFPHCLFQIKYPSKTHISVFLELMKCTHASFSQNAHLYPSTGQQPIKSKVPGLQPGYENATTLV